MLQTGSLKHKIRFAEKAYVRTEVLNSIGNINAIWKIKNCLPTKSQNCPLTTENSTALVNKFNNYFTSVKNMTAQKALILLLNKPLIYPAISAVKLSLDECSEPLRFHMVLEKDVERVIKGFSIDKALGYERVST